MSQMGLVLVSSNEDLQRQEQAVGEQNRQVNDIMSGEQRIESDLAAHIRRIWERNKRAKRPHEDEMLKTLHAMNGKYDAAKEAEIKSQGLPLIWMNITSVKVRAAHSWIRDVLMPAGDKPWSLKPTPMPTLPQQVQQQVNERVMYDAQQYMMATGQGLGPDQIELVQEKYTELVREKLQDKAKEAAARMEDLIEDQLLEGDWDTEFDNILSDLCTWPAAILKGPVLRRKKRLTYNIQQAVGVAEEIIPFVERVDPFCYYPAPGSVEPGQGDGDIEIREWNASDLHNLIGLPGFNEAEIRAAIQNFQAGTTSTDWERSGLKSSMRRARGDEQQTMQDDGRVDVIEFWGTVSGDKLLDWGMEPQRVPDIDKQYNIMAMVAAGRVLCVRFNPDPLGRVPYSKACFEPVPGSFWGRSIPQIIEDCQSVCNAAARALVANMGIASGPQVAVNTNSVSPGQDITNIFPWKIWQLDYSKTGNSTRPPIDFFQPNPMTDQLLKVFEHYSRMADEYSGIPAYTYGSSERMGGAAKTASGLSMLMNAGSKAIKNVVKQVDKGIIATTIHRYWAHNMLHHPDPSVKGDIQIIARGALSLVSKEQNQMRVQEFLANTTNPMDFQIMGPEGRATLLRHAGQGLDLGSDDFIPDEEDLQRRLMQQAQQQAMQGGPQGTPGGQRPPAPREADTAGRPAGGVQ